MAELAYILGLDYGAERVGVAIAHHIARLPRPLTTLPNDENLTAVLDELMYNEHVGRIVVGVPRNMDGTMSEQSEHCTAFAQELSSRQDVPVTMVDETLSSVEAEKILQAQRQPYIKADIDAMAACVILERYFTEKHSVRG